MKISIVNLCLPHLHMQVHTYTHAYIYMYTKQKKINRSDKIKTSIIYKNIGLEKINNVKDLLLKKINVLVNINTDLNRP